MEETESEISGGANVAIAVLAICLMSAGPVIVKSAELPGLSFAFWRVVTAAVFYGVIAFATGRRVGWRELRLSFLGGFFYGANVAAFFTAVNETSIANATVISTLQTAIVLLFVAPLLFGERATPPMYLWSGVATAAVVVVVLAGSDGGGGSRRGDLLALLAMLLFIGYYAGSKSARVHLDVLTYMAGFYVTSTLVLAPVTLLGGQSLAWPPAMEWIPIGLMILIPGTGHFLTNYATKSVPLGIMSMITLLGPVVAAVLAYVFLDEKLSVAQGVAMAVVVAALSRVVARPGRPSVNDDVPTRPAATG